MLKKMRPTVGAAVCIIIFLSILVRFVSLVLNTGEGMYGDDLKCTLFDEGWEQVFLDGRRAPADIPGNLFPEDDTVVIENILPSVISEGTYFSLESNHQDVDIYIDGKHRYHYGKDRATYSSYANPKAYLFTLLWPEDAGKDMRIELYSPARDFTGLISNIYMGTESGIWLHYSGGAAESLVFSFVVLVISFISLIISIVITLRSGNRSMLSYISVGGILYTMRELTGSSIRQLIYSDIETVSNVSYIISAMLMVPFIAYLDKIQEKRYHIFCKIFEYYYMFLALFLHVMDKYEILNYVHFVKFILGSVMAGIIFMGMIIYIEYLRCLTASYRFIGTGYVIFGLSGLITGLIYFIDPGTFFSGIVNFGLVVLLTAAMLDSVFRIMDRRKEEEMAGRMGNVRADFIEGMSDDIGSPVEEIIDAGRVLAKDDSNKHGYEIVKSGLELKKTLSDILEFSRLENHKVALLDRSFNLSEMLWAFNEYYRKKAALKHLMFIFYLDKNCPAKVRGDSKKLEAVLKKLIDNALEYTDKGGVSFTVSLLKSREKTIDDEGEKTFYLSFHIKDTGRGISKEKMDEIFMPFNRNDDNAYHKEGGLGLGVPVAQRLLEMMGSKMEIDTKPGYGTDVFFTIPFKEDPEYDKHIDSTIYNERGIPKFTAPTAEILAVDDTPDNLNVIYALIKGLNVNLSLARSGKEAVTLAACHFYDIILMDYHMPDMDGAQAMNIIKKSGRCGPGGKNSIILAMTSRDDEQIRDRFRREGFDDFLTKPLAPGELENFIWNNLPEEAKIVSDHIFVSDEDDYMLLSRA
ncbi:ATP-binding response regulator [Butyrivibrio sp. MC2013]|uniref:ATP-binding response regulator n=1 Tax=Butyrivibrio sp. MC2013 TaxID=1280686 RepID=UPI00041DAB90|nr:ATP-binding protein [Butyrivibrio sp. MC2013]